MTLSQCGGRLVVAVQAIVAQQPRHPAEQEGRCGVDLGIGLEWAASPNHYGTIERVAHPAPWKEVYQQQRRLARQVSRRIVGSRGHRHAKTKPAALDRRAVNLRRQAIHVLTTRLARRYGTVVVEDLDVAATQRSMGRRVFRRTVSQAGIGQVRPTLAYKCPALGGRLVVAARWFGSSKSHHDCSGYRADLKLGDRVWSCSRCGRLVDRTPTRR
jgi:putative transposase